MNVIVCSVNKVVLLFITNYLMQYNMYDISEALLISVTLISFKILYISMAIGLLFLISDREGLFSLNHINRWLAFCASCK